MLSRIQARPGRTVKQEEEHISRNLVPTIIFFRVNKGQRDQREGDGSARSKRIFEVEEKTFEVDWRSLDLCRF